MQIKKFKIPNSILYLFGLALFLNILRIILFGNTSFIYILWNVFLAAIPFFISYILLLYTNKDNIIKPFFIIGFILWLLFLPNSPYVITDFIHLGRFHAVPIMYDMFLLFASAWVALLMGLYSISHMEKILLLKFSKKVTNILIITIILFTSFGVYVGRYLRFNSWDFFISNNSLITSIWKIFTESNGYANVYGYTALFFIFIYTSYLAFKSSNIRN
ncbi:MAG: DUF1361 domain-containing protein [Candidatus Paceibacterota bacterium]